MAVGSRLRYLKHTPLGLLGAREDEMVTLWPLTNLTQAMAGHSENNQFWNNIFDWGYENTWNILKPYNT